MPADPVDEARQALYRRMAPKRAVVDDRVEYIEDHEAVAKFEQAIRQEERSRYEGLLAAARETERDLAWFSFAGRDDSRMTLADVAPTVEGALTRMRVALAALADAPAEASGASPTSSEGR